MNIKTNAKIQALVTQMAGCKITHVAAAHVCACSLEDEYKNRSEVAAAGIYRGLQLANEFEKRRKRTLFLRSEGDSKTFGIYEATQETADGLDRLYFVGTPKGIVRKLEAERDRLVARMARD